MNTEITAEKSRRNASRLPSESNLRLNSGNRQHKTEQDTSSRHWTLTSEGFPPGVTVDELKHYRRRRQIDVRGRDDLQPEDGQTSHHKDPDLSKETKKTEDSPVIETYFPRERAVLKRPQGNLHVEKDQPMDYITEKSLKYIPFLNVERRKLLRRSTALKPEGEMTGETEVRSQFKQYENPEKAQPFRRPPSLKLEGEFETLTTEQREKFINHIFGERLVLRKKNTLLKMEGDFDFMTEKQVSYVPHEAKERPFLRKRSTSLKLDGEVEFFPEYRSSYIDFPRSRPITYKPMENLRNEGDLEVETETKTKFIDFHQFPVSIPAKPPNNILIEGGFDIRPEYKENYIDFPRARPFTIRPENHLKQEGDFDLKTEKEELSKILNEDLKRPLMVRRESNLKLEGDLEFSTEKREQFKGHELPERLPPPRRDGNLFLEGQMDFKTEMEDKYVVNPTAEPTDFRRKSSFLQSGGFRSVFDYDRTSPRGALPSPNRLRVFEDQPVRSKLIPFKTEHYNSEIVENCNRRSSRRNSKRLKENITDSLPRGDNTDVENFPVRRLPPTDNLRLESELHSICRTPPERKTHLQEQSDDTSDTASIVNHQPSFRLEVYNVDAQPQGFHRGTQRVFPPEGIPTETLSLCPDSFLEKKRSEYYGRNVNSPEVPTYILDKNNNVGGKTPVWDVPRKTEDRHSPPDTAVDRESWSRPNWLTT